MPDDRLRDLARRLRGRSDGGEGAIDEATTGDSGGDEDNAVDPPSPPAEDHQDARTASPKPEPVTSYRDGVPFRRGDPRWPDVWGHRRDPWLDPIPLD
jgi:hypothetical protein